MAGLQRGGAVPQSITVHAKSRVLEVGFSDGAVFRIPIELRRIYSPSAEVQGLRAAGFADAGWLGNNKPTGGIKPSSDQLG
ncbi:MAG TPA: gamma-butyrobetaine hydroxylase-like domain-containing protein, partial [Ramlibacter sp.]